MCCGKKRAQLKADAANAARTSTVVKQAASISRADPPGSQRESLSAHQHSTIANAGDTTRQVAVKRISGANVSFAYVGNTNMTVIGPATGYQYNFDRPGARLYVDPRDRAGLASIRQLRQVR